MVLKRKHVILALAWIASLAISNFIGGVAGFGQGLRTDSVFFGNDAIGTVSALRVLRGGKVQETILLLERRLDAELAGQLFVDHSYRSPYNLFLRSVFGDRLLKQHAFALSEVLEYREEYPPVSGNAAVDAKLMKELAAYRNAPRP
jgi:hypothetical protein